MKYVGKSRAGSNNTRLVRGLGQYTADIEQKDVCSMAMVRSPYAHARIMNIDIEEAMGMDGVYCVLVADDIIGPTNPKSAMTDPSGESDKSLECFALPLDHVTYVGQGVAAVIAEDRYTARRAADLVSVEYEELPVVTDPEAALLPDAPVVVPGWKDNLVYGTSFKKGNVDSALESAHGIVRGRVKKQRYVSVPMEPRAYVAKFDPREERLTVWASTQQPHVGRNALAQILGLPESSIRVIQPDVGGGFGTKVPATDEEILVAYAALKLERPIRWVEERNEYFLTGGHARETILDFEAGYTEEGVLSGLRVHVIGDVGWPSGYWVQCFVTAYCIPTAYRSDDCEVQLSAVVTNKCPWWGYRAFGKEAATFLMDRVLDRISDETGIDRVEVRLRNFVDKTEFPYSQVSGAVLDSGDYAGTMQKLVGLVDIENFRKEQREARENGRLIGLGIGFELTPEGCSMPNALFLQGHDGATVRVSPMGDVTVLTGVTSPGSGNETGIAQLVADTLGVEFERIRVVQGDTDVCPFGSGNYSSRSVMIGGSAALLAAKELREKMFRVAAKVLEVTPDDLEAEGGEIYVEGAPSRKVPISEISRLVYANAHGQEASDVEPGLESTRYFRIGNVHHQPEIDGRFSPYPTWPYMACAMVVEVDPQTGGVKVLRCVGVHDCGKIVNPLLVHANLHGGLAQGLGGALYEELVYDDAGQLLTTTFADYTCPTAIEMPSDLTLDHHETPSPATPLGAKGAGESGVAAILGAVAGAIEDALPDLKLELMETPFVPARVWNAIQAASSPK